MSAHPVQGTELLRTPYFNKGSAFTDQERKDFGLVGLMPTQVQTLDEQLQRAYAQYASRADDLAKNVFMDSMKEQNQVLYYRVSLLHVVDETGKVILLNKN